MQGDGGMAREFMLNIVRQIAYLDIDEMREINRVAKEGRNRWSALGAILDPTAYRDALEKDQFSHWEAQEQIVDHLIVIRELIDKLEAIGLKVGDDGQE